MFANVHEPSQRNVTQKKKNIGMKNVFLSTSDSIIYLHKDEATRDAGQEKLP